MKDSLLIKLIKLQERSKLLHEFAHTLTPSILQEFEQTAVDSKAEIYEVTQTKVVGIKFINQVHGLCFGGVIAWKWVAH